MSQGAEIQKAQLVELPGDVGLSVLIDEVKFVPHGLQVCLKSVDPNCRLPLPLHWGEEKWSSEVLELRFNHGLVISFEPFYYSTPSHLTLMIKGWDYVSPSADQATIKVDGKMMRELVKHSLTERAMGRL